ncbi:MAG: hypothetical protein IT336_03085 [Thermomicrobiales bacterium]|nr:hypothetical protein [Thermomicrobiales bacterium]
MLRVVIVTAVLLASLVLHVSITMGQSGQILIISARYCPNGDADAPFECGTPLEDVTFVVGPERLTLVTDKDGLAAGDIRGVTPERLLIHPLAGNYASVAMGCVADGEALNVEIADVATAIASFLVVAPGGVDIDCAMSFTDPMGSQPNGSVAGDGEVAVLPDTGSVPLNPEVVSERWLALAALGVGGLALGLRSRRVLAVRPVRH